MLYGTYLCSFQGAAAILLRSGPPLWLKASRLSISSGIVHGPVMSNHAPLLSFEIVFYSIASLFAVIGLAWYLFR
jgi:hypothetical protein